MKKRHSAEQIVAKLRQADIELGKRMHVVSESKASVDYEDTR